MRSLAVRAVALVVVTGCNWVFGVEKTKLQDAAKEFFDGPPDAPFACPGAGSAPAFASTFTQVLTHGSCVAYTESRVTNTFSAHCTISGPVQAEVTVDGTIGVDAFTDAVVDPPPNAQFAGKLSPDGDELWLTQLGATGNKITVYRRTTAPGTEPTTWANASDIVINQTDSPTDVGTPSRAVPKRRMFYLGTNGPTEIEEQTPGSWTVVGHIMSGSLGGILVANAPELSPDALRIVFGGEVSGPLSRKGIFYSARAQVSDAFTTFVMLANAPGAATDPFLVEDCSRLYFSGLDSVFYIVEQL